MSDFKITPLSELMGITPKPPVSFPSFEEMLNDSEKAYNFQDALCAIGGEVYAEDYAYLFRGCYFIQKGEKDIFGLVHAIISLVASEKKPYQILDGFRKLEPYNELLRCRWVIIFAKTAYLAHWLALLDEMKERGEHIPLLDSLQRMDSHPILKHCPAYRENVQIIRDYILS